MNVERGVTERVVVAELLKTKVSPKCGNSYIELIKQ